LVVYTVVLGEPIAQKNESGSV